MATCPHCKQTMKDGAGFKRHVSTCAKRPEREELAQMVAGGESLRSIAIGLGVSQTAVRRWLQEYEIPFGRKAYARYELVPALAPLWRQHRICQRCVMIDECELRVRVGLWVYCEAPEPEEVELDGWKVLALYWWRLIQLGASLDRVSIMQVMPTG